jgi:hypothetical protein
MRAGCETPGGGAVRIVRRVRNTAAPKADRRSALEYRHDVKEIEGTSFERHYSVEQLAEMWNLSQDFVRRLFLREPGVIVFHRARPGRRVYRTIRIPESVAARVHQRLARPA